MPVEGRTLTSGVLSKMARLAMSLRTPSMTGAVRGCCVEGRRRAGHRADSARGWFTPRVSLDEASRKAECRKSACPVVCPAKAGMFSRRQTCRGRSQSPVVWIAEVMETETLKPIDKVSPGEATSHRAVIKVNALWPRKGRCVDRPDCRIGEG